MNPFFRNSATPLAYDSVRVADVEEAVDRIVDECRALRDNIVKAPREDKKRRLLDRDHLFDSLDQVNYPIYLLHETHPNGQVREACQRAVETLINFETELYLDEALYRSLKEFADTSPTLSPLERRFLERSMNYYRRNGFQLGPEDRARLKNIDDALNHKELLFQKNISDCDDALTLSETEMDGLSEDFKETHRQEDGSYRVTTRSPDFDPVMRSAKNGDVRRRMYFLYLNRARDANLALLDEVLKLRIERSKLLGFPNFATYHLADVMAGEPAKVWAFLRELSVKISDKAQEDMALLREAAGVSDIKPWDKWYAANLLKQKRFQLDDETVKPYFSLDRVLTGIFDLAEALYGIAVEPCFESPVWHDDVRAYRAVEDGRVVGRFYLDLFPRPNKYSHAACFNLQKGRRLDDGYRCPEAALVCNFTKPSSTRPSLLSHRDVETLFHEFGHLFHDLLTQSPLAYFAGTSVRKDFVEMPSQIMENWVWEKEALQRFAVHYRSEEPIPAALVDKMLAVRHLNSGIDHQQQIFYAALDMTYHDGFEPAQPEDTTDVVRRLQSRYTSFPYQEGTFLQASFGHLTGYASAYYGYLWSRVYADDMYSVFKEHGIYSRQAGKRFRDVVLARGDTAEPMSLIEEFLGRPPKMDAFLETIGIEVPTSAKTG